MTAIEDGVDVLELGVPFSDPTADGPTIQAAAHRALAAAMTLGDVLDLVRRLRADHDMPIVLFGYANPFFRYGYDGSAPMPRRRAWTACWWWTCRSRKPDELRAAHGRSTGSADSADRADDAPGTRRRRFWRRRAGFVYYIMVTGVTGARGRWRRTGRACGRAADVDGPADCRRVRGQQRRAGRAGGRSRGCRGGGQRPGAGGAARAGWRRWCASYGRALWTAGWRGSRRRDPTRTHAGRLLVRYSHSVPRSAADRWRQRRARPRALIVAVYEELLKAGAYPGRADDAGRRIRIFFGTASRIISPT